MATLEARNAAVEPEPFKIIERIGRLIRVRDIPGYMVASDVGACGDCGGLVWDVQERDGVRTMVCAACLPPRRKQGDVVIRKFIVPDRVKGTPDEQTPTAEA